MAWLRARLGLERRSIPLLDAVSVLVVVLLPDRFGDRPRIGSVVAGTSRRPSLASNDVSYHVRSSRTSLGMEAFHLRTDVHDTRASLPRPRDRTFEFMATSAGFRSPFLEGKLHTLSGDYRIGHCAYGRPRYVGLDVGDTREVAMGGLACSFPGQNAHPATR
jgi:hypothetical protein